MSGRRELDRRLSALRETRGILHSMKTLAFMEARKLDQRIEEQRKLVATLDEVAADFLAHHPALQAGGDGLRPLELIVGSERGFCGDFNESLARIHGPPPAGPLRQDHIVIGRKLAGRLGEDPRVRKVLAGPDAIEDVDRVLSTIVAAIDEVRSSEGSVRLTVHFHGRDTDQPSTRTLLPPFGTAAVATRRPPLPPLLNLATGAFLRDLADQYLYAALHEVLVASLWAENQRRARHLDGAVNRLDERIESLNGRGRQLRQEEITEEIEVILLASTQP